MDSFESFNGRIFIWFSHHVIIKVPLPQGWVTFANCGYPVLGPFVYLLRKTLELFGSQIFWF